MIVTGVRIVFPFQNRMERRSIRHKLIGTSFHKCQAEFMKPKTQRPERRTDALSKERIVEAAIAILDADGDAALTFRALATRLATGSGALYWHVADKNDLLAAAAADVIAQ